MVLACGSTHAQEDLVHLPDRAVSIIPDDRFLPDSMTRDLLSARNALEKIKAEYDSVSRTANHVLQATMQKLDSLASLDVIAPGLAKKLDSINQWKSAKITGLQQRMDVVGSKVHAIEQRLGSGFGAMPIPDELKALTSELKNLRGEINLNIDSRNVLPAELLTGLHENIADVGVPDVSGHIDRISIPEVSQPEVNTATIESTLTEVRENVSSNLEQVAGFDEVKAELGRAEPVTEMGEGLREEAVKSKIREEVQREAVNHFAGQQKELEQAIEKLGKLKLKYESVGSIAELPKRRPNLMQGKSFSERSVIGVNLQFQRKGLWMLDVNPYVGYKINQWFTTGIGWNQRVAYDWDQRSFQKAQVVFGPRAFMQAAIGKGFSGRLEGEYMNTVIPSSPFARTIDESNRQWVFTPMAGIVKAYRFARRVNGTMTVMYRFYDPHRRSPYNSPLNVRMGFEIAPKGSRPNR